MQEKYNVTGMTCAACQARVQKSVSKLTGVQECNVNLLKNSMVVTYDDKNVNSGQIIAAVEKAGYGASLQQVKGKSATQAVSPVDTAKKEYAAMRRPLYSLSLCSISRTEDFRQANNNKAIEWRNHYEKRTDDRRNDVPELRQACYPCPGGYLWCVPCPGKSRGQKGHC